MVLNGVSWSGRERDHVFLNLGEGTFADVSQVSGADCIGDGRALAVVDWDDDGRLDFFLKSRTSPRVLFFRNQAGGAGHFLTLDLVGTSCNKDAIGARATVELEDRSLVQTVRAGEGYLSQSSKRLHFGLGSAERVREVKVRWPDGSRGEYQGFEPDRRYRITQGSATPELLPARTIAEFASVEARSCEPISGLRSRVPLVEKLPMEVIGIPAFENEGRRVADLAGAPALVHLWSTTCAACVKELAQIRNERERLTASGLRLVLLTTDPAESFAQVREMLADAGLERDAGFVDSNLSQILPILLADVLRDYDVIPLPTSLLLDGSGGLVALYLGATPFEEILRDVAAMRQQNTADSSNVLAGGSRVIPRPRDWRSLAQELEKIGLTELARFYRRIPRAKAR